MIARITDNQWVYMQHITDYEDLILWEKFSVSKPNQYVDYSQYNWDGVYRKYNRAKKRIAKPLLAMLKKICKENKLPLEVIDSRPEWKYNTNIIEINDDLLKGIKLEDYQIKAINQCIKHECGIIEIPTGGGKGEIICGICAAIQCPTLILADQRIVVDQLKRRLELRDVATNVGLFYAGKRPSGELIVVGLIQSLNAPKKPPKDPKKELGESDDEYFKRLNKWEKSYQAYNTRLKNVKFLNDYVKKAEMIIVDECDKATSESFKNLFKYHYKGRRRYGFSGTPFDPDKPVEAVVVQEHLGSIISSESRNTILEKGRIIPTTYKMIAIGPYNLHESSTFDIAYDEHLVNNNYFHNVILNIIQKYYKESILILVDRENLGLNLLEKINNIGVQSHFIYGKTPKRERDRVLKSFENREFNVLIGGKIINRGLDLAGGCDKLILAGSSKLQSDLIQKVGRALRRNEKGKSTVFDFYFRGNRHLYRHSKARLKAMVQQGFDAQVIFPGGVIDGKKLIENYRFRVAKRYG